MKATWDTKTCSWEDNIKMDLEGKDFEVVEFIHLAQDMIL
jgi:hypothetical protein